MSPRTPFFPLHGQSTTKPYQPESQTSTPTSPKAKHNRQRSFNLTSLTSRFSTTTTSTPSSPTNHLRTRSLKTEQPLYIIPHIGDPCTSSSLDHLLLCGHKILTPTPIPEACARNCHVRKLKPDYAQPRDLDNSFACFACITAQVQNCIETAEIVEVMQLACEGMRMSRPLWVESEFEVAVEEVIAGKGKARHRVVSSPVKAGAETEERRESKALEFKIPKYSDALGRMQGSALEDKLTET